MSPLAAWSLETLSRSRQPVSSWYHMAMVLKFAKEWAVVSLSRCTDFTIQLLLLFSADHF